MMNMNDLKKSVLLLMIFSLYVSEAFALRIASRVDRQLYPGVTLATIRTASPATDVKAVFISLCSQGIHLQTTGSTDQTRTTGTWGNAAGVQMAMNADFYTFDTRFHIYGDAVSNGNRGASTRRGNHSD